MRIKTVADKTDDFEAVWQCWTSQQMSHAQLELHLKDADFAEWYKAKIAGLNAVMVPSPAAPNADALAAEMLAGLEGVTPGEWELYEHSKTPLVFHVRGQSEVIVGLDGVCLPDKYNDRSYEEDAANMRHIHANRPTAIRALLSERAAMKAELAGLREAISRRPEWHWPADDTSSDACADSQWQVAENCDLQPGEILAYSVGGVWETLYYAFLPAADDADGDDEFMVDEPTEEAVKEKIAAELARRAALKGADHDPT